MIDKVVQYANNHSHPLPEVLEWLERESYLKSSRYRMLSGPTVGRFLINFSKMLSPTKVLEIGTFTGYSAICLAQGLAPEGRLITLEKNDELYPLIEEAFRRASIADRVEVVIGSALEYLKKCKINREPDLDLVYIDGDKREYLEYYNLVLPLLKCGGYIIADNVLWNGTVAEPSAEQHPDRQREAIEQFNRQVFEDRRVENYILPLRDGLNIIRKVAH